MSSGGWARNEPVAAKRRVSVSVASESGTPAPPESNFIGGGMVFISGVSQPNYVLALGSMTNNRRELDLSNDTVEATDTGADTLTLTAHLYESGDGPIQSDTTAGNLIATTDYFVRKIDANKIALYPTLADAYADTNRLNLNVDATGAVLSTVTASQRGVWGEFTYEATQAETDHPAKETLILVDGPGFRRMMFAGGGATVVMQEPASTAFDQVSENGRTYGQQLRIIYRTLAAKFSKTGNDYVYRDDADTKDSHSGTVTAAGRTARNIIDPD